MTSNIKDHGSLRHQLDIKQAKPGSSWDSVFSAAASVKLEDVDDDFLERTQSKLTPLAELAEFAKSVTTTQNRNHEAKDCGSRSKKTKRLGEEEAVGGNPSSKEISVASKSKNEPKRATKKVKRTHKEGWPLEKDSPEGGESSTATPILEGKMVSHPHKDEQIMVLLDNKAKVVYSGLRRTDEDGLIAIGRIRSSGKIKWKAGAFENDADNDGDVAVSNGFPFPTDPDDHCESPLAAYKDIVPLLQFFFPKKDRCRIYDPYFCDGAVKCNLASLGFPLVHNVKEDCYQVWSSGSVPALDVLVTNPPYSDDHIPKLVDFLSSPTMASKAWFLLMPQWVSKKPYFVEKWDKKAFFIIPGKRYVYIPPKNFRDKRVSDVHKKSSPFVTIWYVWGGSVKQTNDLYDLCLRLRSGQQYDVARSKNGLRDLRRKKSGD